MKLIDVNDRLTEDGKYILAHLIKDNWGDSDDKHGGRYWKVVKFVRGLSVEERNALPPTDQRKITWRGADEGFNNEMPYQWETFGPGSFFGQEVDFWCELPTDQYKNIGEKQNERHEKSQTGN